ncbi:tetratricopeptide repeat-containing sensor histidine kinase [Pseudotenacibaculum haliotis]|uniref:Tetratricopeptide repeat protein n=1 Tax=Pseudotenacibaculum haliotis TaxID=1862138 RepID=A0ABW5LTI5_9FLAO
MKTKKLPSLIFSFFFSICLYPQKQEKKDLNYYVRQYDKADNIIKLVEPLDFFEKDKEVSLSNNYIQRATYDLYYITKIHYKLGDINRSEEAAIEGLKLLDGLPMTEAIKDSKLSFYNHLGILNREKSNYNKSLDNYAKSLSFSLKKSDSAMAYNNIGVVYIYMNEYEKAKQNFLKSYRAYKELKDTINIALPLGNLGRAQSKLNEEGALSNLKEALKIREKIDSPVIYENYEFLTEYYLDRKDSVNALMYAKKSYVAAKKFNRLTYKYEALSKLVNLGEHQYGKELFDVFDILLEKNKMQQASFAEARYSVDKEKEKTINEKNRREKAEIQAERNKVIYGSAGGFILMSSIFLYFYLRTRHKKEKLQERYATERQISKKLHDEVANEIFYVMSKMENEAASSELIENLEGIYHKTRDISKANAPLDLGENFGLELKDLLLSYQSEIVNIFTRNMSEISWNNLSSLKKETLYRVLQELMTNMRKHSQATLVTIRFERQQSKTVIAYQDNGIGGKLKKSNGLRNTENRMELAGGSIIFECEANKGFHAKIVI